MAPRTTAILANQPPAEKRGAEAPLDCAAAVAVESILGVLGEEVGVGEMTAVADEVFGPELDLAEPADELMDVEVDMEDETLVELDGMPVGLAARLAEPPPTLWTVLHPYVFPGGGGAGVVGSPWWNVDPPYTPGASSVGSPSHWSNPGS